MRLVPMAWMLTVVVPTIGFGAAVPPANTALQPPIATRQNLFSIPFQVPRGGQSARDPVEIRLYVSSDGGANWQICDRVTPEKGYFLFRAVTDGEYWFIIQTLDRSGQLRPARVDRPGLRVLVDTTLPDLQLEARQAEAGQITVRWQMSDPRLKPESLTIQYRSAADRAWRTVAIDRQSITSLGATQAGQVIWWPEANAKLMEIRAEVADTAGNLAVSHAKVNLDRSALADRPAAPGPAPDQTRNLAHAAQSPMSSWRASTDSVPPLQGQTNAQDHVSAPYEPLANEPSTSEPSTNDQASSENTAPSGGNLYPSSRYTEQAASPAGRDGSPEADTPASAKRRRRAWPPSGSLAASVNPPVRSEHSSLQQAPGSRTGYDVPEGVRPQMLNTRLFELEYDVDLVGPPGTGAVELWGTRDGGRSWTSMGVDHDGRSPMLVTVHDEGVYGFRVVAGRAPGARSERPRSGDPPKAWIGVDLTKPKARIVSAQLGTGDQAGQLIIQWDAEDQMLSAQPVSLLFSDTGGGDWTPIASGLENAGRYAWSLDRPLPRRIYLRLEVRDEAGNVGTFETPEAVALDQRRPGVHIRSVRPVVDTVGTPSLRYRSR